MTEKVQEINPQPVDAQAVASYFGFTATLIRRMAECGKIPSMIVRNGKRNYYRFYISEVERALRHETPGVVSARSHLPRSTKQGA